MFVCGVRLLGNLAFMAKVEGNKGSQSLYCTIMAEKISSMEKKAKSAKDRGDLDQSLAILSRAIALDPTKSELFRERAVIYHQLGDLSAAIANYNKSNSLNPPLIVTTQLADAYFKRGEKFESTGNLQLALNDFTAATNICPEVKCYLIRRMECLLAVGQCQQCLMMVERALERGSSNAQLHLIHAKLCLRFEKTGDAYQSIMTALELDPTNQEVLEMKKEREKEAVKLHNQAIKFFLSGQRDVAYSKISAAIACDPKPGQFHLLRGKIERQNGRYAAAVDEFLTTIDKCKTKEDNVTVADANRQLVLTYNDFALHCFKKKRFNEAIQLLNRAVEEEKGESGIFLNRGECFYHLGNLSFALADYCRAQQLSPNDRVICTRVAMTQCQLGLQKFETGNYRDAKKLFTSAISNHPKQSQFYLYRARTSWELDLIDETKQDIVQLLLLDQTCESCLPLIARVFPGKTRADILNSSVVGNTSKDEYKESGDEGDPTSNKHADLIKLFCHMNFDLDFDLDI